MLLIRQSSQNSNTVMWVVTIRSFFHGIHSSLSLSLSLSPVPAVFLHNLWFSELSFCFQNSVPISFSLQGSSEPWEDSLQGRTCACTHILIHTHTHTHTLLNIIIRTNYQVYKASIRSSMQVPGYVANMGTNMHTNVQSTLSSPFSWLYQVK